MSVVHNLFLPSSDSCSVRISFILNFDPSSFFCGIVYILDPLAKWYLYCRVLRFTVLRFYYKNCDGFAPEPHSTAYWQDKAAHNHSRSASHHRPTPTPVTQ